MDRTTRQTFDIEQLERRQLMAAIGFRSIDGTGNNLANPDWGSAGTQLLRETLPAYADGVSSPAGEDRVSAREISNVIVDQTTEERIPDDRFMSAMIYGWGQFIDHDLDLTPNATPAEAFNVVVPNDPEDPFSVAAGGPGVIRLNRSVAETDGVREQTNVVTAYIDGSMIYGSDDATALALRTLNGGRLKTSPGADGVIGTDDDLLPFNSQTYFPQGVLSMDNAVGLPTDQLFAAGDVRANENIELTSLHTLFVREHNRLAAQIEARRPGLSDERIYQQARAMVGAEIQAITFNQWLPTLLGTRAIARYDGYDSAVNPGIANEFSTALFRVGHSMLGQDVEFLDNDGEEVHAEVELNEGFFNPSLVNETDIGPILKYLASDPSSQVDSSIVDQVRNFLFGPPAAGGFDLASLNIQRGRDHGLADYNTVREAYGLPRVDNFDDITANVEVQQKLEQLYGSVDDIDLWVGALAENHVRGSSTGPLIQAAISDQFERVRDGDRFWYQRALSDQSLRFINGRTLADVISDNTPIDNLQDNVFAFQFSISGQVYSGRSNARQSYRERGLAGWTVQLLDEEGNIADTTPTKRSGRYTFKGRELGTFTIQVIPPEGWTGTTEEPQEVQITRGMDVRGIDFNYTAGVRHYTRDSVALPSETTMWTMFDQHDPNDSEET